MNNDLISREALKEKLSGANYQTYTHEYGYAIPTECVMNAIDNAPTVEAFTKDDIAGAYNEGYMCGNKEAEKARPQGEWKRDNYGDVFCSNCGVECACNEEGLYSLGRFCHHCGADMRGGKE